MLVILQVFDVISTNRALKNGALEANPIVHKFMDRLGKLWWLPKVTLALGGGWLLLGAGTIGSALLGILCVGYGWIVWRNFGLAS
ncbi:DUF5658 family protein [Desulfovulcanus sp.]